MGCKNESCHGFSPPQSLLSHQTNWGKGHCRCGAVLCLQSPVPVRLLTSLPSLWRAPLPPQLLGIDKSSGLPHFVLQKFIFQRKLSLILSQLKFQFCVSSHPVENLQRPLLFLFQAHHSYADKASYVQHTFRGATYKDRDLHVCASHP